MKSSMEPEGKKYQTTAFNAHQIPADCMRLLLILEGKL